MRDIRDIILELDEIWKEHAPEGWYLGLPREKRALNSTQLRVFIDVRRADYTAVGNDGTVDPMACLYLELANNADLTALEIIDLMKKMAEVDFQQGIPGFKSTNKRVDTTDSE